MAWKYGILFDDALEFLSWMRSNLSAKMTEVHVHHTYSPNHSHFNGKNHRDLQDRMKKYHLKRGFSDIAQHITIFPDGKVMTGRNVNTPPASATGHNDADDDGKHPFMFEMLGNFDKGNDNLTGKQLQSAEQVTRYFWRRGSTIRFHREMADKSCPGTGVGKTWFVNRIKNQKSEPYDKNQNYHRELKINDPMLRGEDVKRVQNRLKSSPVDGIFGYDTREDVVAWQRVHDEKGKVVPAGKGLAADGIVGQKTWQALFGSVT
ncbi:hypothetical protein SAMN05444392_10744 [Seinonella peptonophila]|uniref:Uncharacterized protein n=1 Tax=Seinonella peptonophila TaxID=112248 RepID=A0A1M4YMS7_9BACL|nr:N-acetylmuramoyl-L-alanine amidase [Seinonella peptonophila]SHF07051.1 hypothetical protein SAMN05444392_10744 [Seinonella peptonophila]